MNDAEAEAVETRQPPERTGTETTVIARTSTRLAVPVILLTAIALLIQGHNRPGGGFIAGVLTVSAFALIYVVFGLDYVEEELLHRRPIVATAPDEGIVKEYSAIFALGLGLATAGGLGAAALGYPFLTQAVAVVEGVALYGDIELASALVFDLGVYAVVVGGLLTILAVVGGE